VTIIDTVPALCQKCLHCAHVCPVKAIRVDSDQTSVAEERCIACAECIVHCPQHAKRVRDDVTLVRSALAEGQQVVASVAPSAAAYLPFESFEKMSQALQCLGFAGTHDATLGAAMVGAEIRRLLSADGLHKPLITTSCPAIVRLIERHHPNLFPYLAPLVSPMIAHGRWLKKTWTSDIFVVFVSPCLAAKVEAADHAVAGAVDAVLTLSELAGWLEAEGLAILPAQDQALSVAPAPQRLFSLEGGLARTVDPSADLPGTRVITVSGMESCLKILAALRSNQLDAALVQMMLCAGGCVHAPLLHLEGRTSIDAQRIWTQIQTSSPTVPPQSNWPDLRRTYSDQSQQKATPPTPSAIHRAEYMAKVVLDLTPNLVVAVDSNLLILSLSPSAERAFGCDLALVQNRPLRDLLSPVDDFVRAWKESKPVVKSKVRYRADLIVEQTVVPAVEQNMLVAIMRNITEEEKRREELSWVAKETIARTQDVINFQMQVAHEIASLLGETTAESKIQLGRLIQLVKGLEGIEVS
jgi:iron only hydrogenase large subunit-like protein